MHVLTRILVCLIVLSCPSADGQAQLSRHVANYDMDVLLDVQNKQLKASTDLTWINPSGDTVRELQFHLYLNAFRNSATTWMREGEQFIEFTGSQWFESCGWGWVVVHNMHDAAGNVLTHGFEFRQPEDGNPEDWTVLAVPLKDPVMPYDSLQITFDWTAQIPRSMVRTGYNLDFYFMAQWFPKLGVYEPEGMRYAREGGWNCHQYHANSEYYADFGTYDVDITLPEEFIVGASGIKTSTEDAGNGMKTWKYRADDVIDFTWSASPHFVVMENSWKDTRIELMLYPEHVRFAPRYFEPLLFAFEYLDTHIGDYPYPQLTVIGAPIHGIFAGAMEYPTLITAFSSALLPSGFRSTETLVVHEFIHQYFMQMVATNEQEEAWMDEGITSYYEAVILDSLYGSKTSLCNDFGIRVGNFENARHNLFSSGFAMSAPASLPTWEYHPTASSVIAYDKTALWLKTLEGLIGSAAMQEAMRTYFEQWKFRHPCGRDFRDVVNRVVIERLPAKWPEGMDWYFDQVIDGTELCDYRVHSIRNKVVNATVGYVGNLEDCLVQSEPANRDERVYVSTAIVQRRGGLRIPLEVRVTFDNGSVEQMVWDGEAGETTFAFTGPRKIVSVELDPDFRNRMDIDIINNSRTVEAQRRGLKWYTTHCLTRVQHLMEGLTLFM